MEKRRLFQNWPELFTLKSRIILIFAFSFTIMFLGIGVVSYYAITSILNNKINAGVESNLKQIELALTSTLANLNHVSQQLASQGDVGIKLDQFLYTKEPFEKITLLNEMKTNLNIITFANPGIGLVMYYYKDDKSFFLENAGIRANFNPDTLPLIASYYQINYYGPHISNDRFSNQYVLSALRKIDLSERDDAYVYIETGFKLTQNILETDKTGIKTFHLMLDNDGRIAYSEEPDIFPINTMFGGGGDNKSLSGLLNGYYWFKATSNQGWSVVSIIPTAEYNRERNQWITRMLLLSVVFLIINVLLALFLWDFVYRPLNKFEKEIKWLESGNFQTEISLTRIPEFDDLLTKFQAMKQQILDLITEVKTKEKRRADLEIEKLLYQINPHFLMNTLDTAHWLAVINNQAEIDEIVQSLNKLLSYNLGKKGRATTLADEIGALQQYMVLQKIRHEFNFDIQIKAGEEVMDLIIPRFILQPIVENAIYHGVSKHGLITVTVELHDWIEISISDNGAGITEAKIQELLSKEQVDQEKVGMGIGMNYVKRILESYYSGAAALRIESRLGEGTSVHLCLPVSMRGL